MARAHRLPAIAAAALCACALMLLTGCTPESKAELKTYDGINQIRAEYGLPPLTPDPALLDVARFRSRDMAAKNYFSHQPPDGCNYFCLLQAQNVPLSYAGENIAWNTYDWARTADEAIKGWRNSPPHLENILNCHYERFATGVAKAANGTIYYTMIFEGARAC